MSKKILFTGLFVVSFTLVGFIQADEKNLQIIETKVGRHLQRDGCLKKNGVELRLWVGDQKGQGLIRPLMEYYDAQGKFEGIGWARRVEYKVNLEQKQILLLFRDLYFDSPDGDAIWFEERIIPFPLP